MMKNSRSLNVVMHQLTHIPDEVFQEAKTAEVTMVDLCKNKFTSIPPGLKIISEDVTELNLSMNLLIEIPDFICKFVKLKYLDLGKNQLTNLPTSLKTLNLRELVLSHNKFIEIPECVYGMVGLEILLISDNKISEVDVGGLLNLKRIATLDLTNNNIRHVPFELGNMKQLR